MPVELYDILGFLHSSFGAHVIYFINAENHFNNCQNPHASSKKRSIELQKPQDIVMTGPRRDPFDTEAPLPAKMELDLAKFWLSNPFHPLHTSLKPLPHLQAIVIDDHMLLGLF